MIALVTDIATRVTPVLLRASDPKDGVEELISEHDDIFVNYGLTPGWMQNFGLDEIFIDDLTRYENVSLAGWMLQIDPDSNDDDQVITAFLIDSKNATATHTGIFFGAYGEFFIFQFNEHSPDEFREAIYDRIAAGLEGFMQDSIEGFKPSWVEENRDTLPEIQHLLDGLRYLEFKGNGRWEEYNTLKLYVIGNQ